MINLLQLSKFFFIIFFFSIFTGLSYSTEETIDIWKEIKDKKKQSKNISDEDENQDSLILIKNNNEIGESINEEKIDFPQESLFGLFDPEENNLKMNMWSNSDGNEIKKILSKINNLKLSSFSEDLFFRVLFTNAYAPKKNLSPEDFLNFKIRWLIKNERILDLEDLLEKNPTVGESEEAVKYIVAEYLSSANIRSACDKIEIIDKSVNNNYLQKIRIYCLINEQFPEEATLILDLLKEKGFEDNFFEDKINFLLGYKSKADQKILDNELFNFYLSHITSENFEYNPNQNTNKYIWRYLSSSNLLNTENLNELENEEVINVYEQAASINSIEKKEIFNIYKRFLFNINQLINVTETYKNLPNYKARALVYQSILLSDSVEKKLKLIFLLKSLFDKDKIFGAYSDELSDLLKTIEKSKVPDDYVSLVEKYSEQKGNNLKNIKFDNDIIHRSKLLKYFLDEEHNMQKVKKDLKTISKKVKKNKKYFISIKDIIVLESLKHDGIELPKSLDFNELSSQLTVPQGLIDLANNQQTGLAILKTIEIIGEDKIEDLDPETIYFLNKVLNQLNLLKFRNEILSIALPFRV